MRPTRAAFILALGLLTGACSSGSQAPEGGQAGSTEIRVANIAYEPDRLEVDAGETVVWINEDSGVRHTVTSGEPAGETVPGVSEGDASKPDGLFNGDLPDAGSEFTFTFEKAGTYAYFCEVHPSMTAEITVR